MRMFHSSKEFDGARVRWYMCIVRAFVEDESEALFLIE